jgi:hypothetical protein
MTPEEYEVAYCKGKRQAMEFFSDWLRDHIRVAKRSSEDGMDPKKVLEGTLEFMGNIADKMEAKLATEPTLISKEISEKQ